MPRLRSILPLALLVLASACIDVPEVVDPPPPDAGSETPPDAGQPSDAGTTPVPSFTFTVSPLQDSAFQGETRDLQLSISRTGGFAESVSISLVDAPAGISAQPVTIPTGFTTATLKVSVSTTTEPGSKSLTARAVAGSLSREASISLNVTRLGELLVRWVSPSDARVYTNANLALEATVEGGTAESVELRDGAMVLARLTAPPFNYSWNTAEVPEGEHRLTAYAIRGDQEFASFERTVIVDRTAPTTETRTPTQTEANVSARTPIEVTFSEPLRASTVTAANVTLTANGGTVVAQSTSLSEDGRRLTLTTAAPLPTPSTMTVNLGTAEQPVTDLAGNALVLSAPWTFTVPVWQALGGAISAYAGATPAENVVMKLDSDGKPVIAWSEFDGATKNIHVSRWNGYTWTSLGSGLSALPAQGTSADLPALLITPTSGIVVSWIESTNTGNTRNVYARRWKGDGWDALPEVPLQGTSNTWHFRSWLAATHNGTIYLYTGYFNGSGTEIKAFSLPPGSSAWNNVSVNLPPNQFNSSPTSVAGQGDNIYATYNAYFDSVSARAVGVLKNSREQIGTPILSTTEGCSLCSASIAINGSGFPSVAWSEDSPSDSAQSTIYFTQWIGSSWHAAQLVSKGTTSNISPSLVIGEDGRSVLAWSGFASPERVILVYLFNGTTWEPLGPPLSARSGASSPGYSPSLAIDQESRPVVAWTESDGVTTSVFVRKYNM